MRTGKTTVSLKEKIFYYQPFLKKKKNIQHLHVVSELFLLSDEHYSNVSRQPANSFYYQTNIMSVPIYISMAHAQIWAHACQRRECQLGCALASACENPVQKQRSKFINIKSAPLSINLDKLIMLIMTFTRRPIFHQTSPIKSDGDYCFTV